MYIYFTKLNLKKIYITFTFREKCTLVELTHYDSIVVKLIAEYTTVHPTSLRDNNQDN